MVDDEGVDLAFNLKGTPKALAVQVKSRFASKKSGRRTFSARIRRKVFRPRSDLYVLFVLFDDVETFDIEHMWLVPSLKFQELTAGQTEGRSRLVFAVSTGGTANRWVPYHCGRRDLADRIVAAIQELHGEQ
jgi:hypothetical protein